MDYQNIVDSIYTPACVVSVEKKAKGSLPIC